MANTGTIGGFKIISENGVAAGVRRIEALTGSGVRRYYAELEKHVREAAGLLKTSPEELAERIRHLLAETKSLRSELEAQKSRAAKEALGDVTDQVIEIKGVKLLAARVSGVDMNGLRELGDQLKEKLGEGVVILLSDAGGKVNIVAMATEGVQKQGAHAGNLIRGIAKLVGGGGGGRPNMAQAGGKNPAGIESAIEEAARVLESQLQ